MSRLGEAQRLLLRVGRARNAAEQLRELTRPREPGELVEVAPGVWGEPGPADPLARLGQFLDGLTGVQRALEGRHAYGSARRRGRLP